VFLYQSESLQNGEKYIIDEIFQQEYEKFNVFQGLEREREGRGFHQF